MNFKNDFNISPTLKISPSGERQKDERNKPSSLYWPTVLIQTALMRCMLSFSKYIFYQDNDTKAIVYSFATQLHVISLYRLNFIFCHIKIRHPPKISPSVIFGMEINISPVLFSGKHGMTYCNPQNLPIRQIV